MNIAVTGARFSVSHLVAGNPTEDSLFRGFSEIDNLIQSVPSPAYDGPFSDRSLERKPLSNPGEEISGDTAKEIALDFLWDVEDVDSIRVELAGGTIPYHMVTAKRSDGTEATAAVAVQGGFVLWATDQRNPGIPRIDVENARQSAVRFLAEKGFSALIETGWRKSGPGGDRVVFNYAKVKSVNFGGADTPVIMYPDLVKVEVGLDNGQVVAFDQVPLLTNSGGRPGIRPPLISSSQAYRTLKEGLKAEGEPRLAVIPMTGQREVMAWEFKVISNQDLYLIYVNAMTGQEEMVLQVINDESGSLTS